jgi:hypothetical protein
MDFIKKHYEKILLSAVLLGLVGALVCMLFIIPADKQQLDDMSSQVINGTVKPLPDLDLTNENNALVRLQSLYQLDFDTTNKLFNPVEWQKTPDGKLIKIKNGNEVGVGAAVVTRITPLYLILSLDSVVTNDVGARYGIGVEHQAASNPALRRKQSRYVSEDDRKKDLFTLLEVKGAPENPDQLVLKLTDTGETATVSKDKPFQRVDGYAADLKYDPEKKNFNTRRAGTMVSFGGEDYNIVAIDSSTVILSAQSNQKRTTLQYTPTP